MLVLRECKDIDKGRAAWKMLWPQRCVFDLWEVRACFAETYGRPACFLLAEQNDKPVGMLPLSWVEEEKCYAFFPGETWLGKTWLEQNKIPVEDSIVRRELLASVAGKVHLRYLEPEQITGDAVEFEMDEIGYLFHPGHYGYSFERFFGQFSRKSRKNFEAEEARLGELGITFRYNHLPDVDRLFTMNRNVFGEYSYFSDPRFLASFEKLAAWLWDNRFLTVTTVVIGGSIAAVDIGALWGRCHTVLAGGADPEFRGVAKLINFHHIKHSCRERLEVVDFLCGDFGWKERFHLTPRPLYKISPLPRVRTGRNEEPERLHSEAPARLEA